MSKVKLNLNDGENAFFTDVWVFAIATFGLKDYRFCWLLNKSFGLDLRRNTEFDIPFFEKIKKKSKTADLFEFNSEKAVQEEKPFYFSFYQHDIPRTETGIYLYNNRCLHSFLIPEWKHADYLLYMPHNSGFTEYDIMTTFENLKEVQWIRNINLFDGGFKSKQNLLF